MPVREPALMSARQPATAKRKGRVRKPSKSRVAPPRIRVLPVTMVMAMLLCGVKMIEAYQGGKKIHLMMQPAIAQDNAPQDTNATEIPKPPPASDNREEEAVKVAKIQEQNEQVLGRNREFSQVELDILQSLAERRNQLEERSRELDLKEKLLEGTELRINDKITEIKQLEAKVSELLEKYSNQEESHIRSLVKIYENMKPKSAAAIFNELELPILLEVIDQMSERKVAPVLAAMNPMKAKEVTADLANMRKLNALNNRSGTQ